MKSLGKNRKLSIEHGVMFGVLILYLCLLVLSFYKGEILHVQPGFVICKNDCAQYDRLSDYILEKGKLYPAYYDGTYHSSYFCMGFTILVAIIKGLFRNNWQIAYTLLNGILLCILVLSSSRIFSRRCHYSLIFFASMVFIISNRYLNIYSRTLLPDHLFAVGTGLTFILLVSGTATGKRKHIVGAILIALIMSFIRPNGLFLLTFSTVFFLLQYLPKRLHRVINPVAPLIVSLAIFFFSTGLTAYLVKNLDELHFFPQFSQKVFSQLLENNYLGDNMVHNNHIGTWIVNFPYGYWIHNDGSWTAIVGSVLKRIPKVFEIQIPVYDDLHNYIRYVDYGTLYLLFLVYLVYSIRLMVREPRYLLMASLIAGYLISFISVSHIELRYILTFDVCIILCSSFMAGKAIEFLSSHRKKGSITQKAE